MLGDGGSRNFIKDWVGNVSPTALPPMNLEEHDYSRQPTKNLRWIAWKLENTWKINPEEDLLR